MTEYLKDYQGKADTKTITATETGVVPEFTDCRFVQIFNFNVENDSNRPYSVPPASLTETSGLEIYFGFNGTEIGQIFPGEKSDIYPISNLNQLVLRSRPGTTRTVWLTYFW
jgi:hypothetical protein